MAVKVWILSFGQDLALEQWNRRTAEQANTPLLSIWRKEGPFSCSRVHVFTHKTAMIREKGRFHVPTCRLYKTVSRRSGHEYLTAFALGLAFIRCSKSTCYTMLPITASMLPSLGSITVFVRVSRCYHDATSLLCYHDIASRLLACYQFRFCCVSGTSSRAVKHECTINAPEPRREQFFTRSSRCPYLLDAGFTGQSVN